MPLPPYIAAQARSRTRATRPIIRPSIAAQTGSVAAPTAGLHFTPELLAELGAGGRRARARDAACRRGHVPAGEGRGHRRAIACMPNGRDAGREPRPTASTPRARGGGRIVAVGTTALRTLESAASADGMHPSVRRRDRHLHHAGLSIPRGGCAADQFPSAALDPVHAGLRLRGAGRDEGGLCGSDRRALSLLFLWRRLPVIARRA